MKRSALIWILSLLMLMSLASASAFAQDEEATGDEAAAETTSEDGEASDGEMSDDEASDDTEDGEEGEGEAEEEAEPAPIYVEYPCVDADGNVVEAPMDHSDDADGDEGEVDDTEDADDADASEDEAISDEPVLVQIANFQTEVDDTEADDTEEPDDTEEAEAGDEEAEEEEMEPVPDCKEPPPPPPPGPPPPPVNPWYGVYWNNPTFTGPSALQRTDDFVQFNWGNESPYTPTMGADYNSMRWTHTERSQPAGFYRVQIASDYGARLDVNGARIVDTIRFGNAAPFNTFYWIRDGLNHNFRFDYFHHTGPSIVSIDVQPTSEFAAPFGYGTISGTPVLRDGPGTEYFSNGRLANGQRVKLMGQRNLPGNWVGVITDEGEAGWINVFHLLTNYPVDRMQLWPFTPDGVTAGEPRGTVSRDFPYINVRYQPKGQADVIAQAPQGMNLALVGRTASNSYLLVRMWEGTLGWAPAGGIDTNVNISTLPMRWDDTVPAAESE